MILPVIIILGVGAMFVSNVMAEKRVSYSQQLDLCIKRVADFMMVTGDESRRPSYAEIEACIARARELGRIKDAEGLEAVLASWKRLQPIDPKDA